MWEVSMSNLIEIRWHGRGGQGAKTASLLLADAAFNTGKYIQGFPEYGPERMGAPITAYNRISDTPITVHSNIYEPDFVVVVDDTLLDSVDVTAGLKPFNKRWRRTKKIIKRICRKSLQNRCKKSFYGNTWKIFSKHTNACSCSKSKWNHVRRSILK